MADLFDVPSESKKASSALLFIDEIHRWNKSQQDALLPHIEDGTIILIGATTENPSFEVIPALLSPTKLMKDLDYGKGYKYPHDYEGHTVAQDYLPEKLKGRRYYRP